MMTLRQLSTRPETILSSTSLYLSDLAEARGKQELYTRQAPQRLKVLREHALVESAVSSNRIEGVEVDQTRIKTIVFGKSPLRDRDEEEVRGYRKALKVIHEQGIRLPVSENTICDLHRLARGEIGGAGRYKERESDIIERYSNGTERVRFKTVEAAKTASYMGELIELWNRCLSEQWVHPLVAMAAFNLDFLCIHPFRDGNGRVSRLILLLQCYHLGYEVGRYISLERIIEQNKERYYETLEFSSHRWHESRHNPWHYVNYVLFVLKTAYLEFENRLGLVKTPRGAKTDLVKNVVSGFSGEFKLTDLERACPGVSRDMIRRVLRDLGRSGAVECLGRGPGAPWRKKGNTLERG